MTINESNYGLDNELDDEYYSITYKEFLDGITEKELQKKLDELIKRASYILNPIDSYLRRDGNELHFMFYDLDISDSDIPDIGVIIDLLNDSVEGYNFCAEVCSYYETDELPVEFFDENKKPYTIKTIPYGILLEWLFNIAMLEAQEAYEFVELYAREISNSMEDNYNKIHKKLNKIKNSISREPYDFCAKEVVKNE